MKEYIYQFYNEGLATTFYLRPVKYLKNNLKNKKILKIVLFVFKIIYTILVLIFAGYMFYRKFPLQNRKKILGYSVSSFLVFLK